MTEQPYEERELLAQVAVGSEVAFSQLYQHYFVQLHPTFLARTASVEQTEEIVQETFIRVWLHRDQLPAIEHFRAWIFKVATRVFLHSVRRQALYESKLEVLSGAGSSSYPDSPQEVLYVREVKRLVEEAIQLMPDRRREIYQLSRKEGLRIDEIAKRLGLSVGTVKNTLSQALQSIRNYLEHAGHGPLIVACLCLQLF